MIGPVILDASALLALLFDEPGAERVMEHLETASISSVNWSEVGARLADRGADARAIMAELGETSLEIVPFARADAEAAAALRTGTRHLGLSLGDRACLALAQRMGGPALTSDRSWAQLDIGVPIQPIR